MAGLYLAATSSTLLLGLDTASAARGWLLAYARVGSIQWRDMRCGSGLPSRRVGLVVLAGSP